MEKYILVQWPESQSLMEKEWFNECIFAEYLEGHIDPGGSAYFVPEELYNTLYK